MSHAVPIVVHGPLTPFVPVWYPPLCIGFDLVVAGTIVSRLRAWSALHATRGQ